MLLEELVKFLHNSISRSAVSKGKVIILSINREILCHNIIELIDHRSDCFDLI